MVKKIICWAPILTDHQAFTYSALARMSGSPITCFTARKWDRVRRSQGWIDADVSWVQRVKLPLLGFFIYSVFHLIRYRNAVHIFGSPFEDKRMFLLICLAVRFKIKVYLIAESYSPVAQAYFGSDVGWQQKIKSFIRPSIYKIYVSLMGENLCGIFAISSLACKQYREAGFPGNKILPFGYFVPSINSKFGSKKRRSGGINVVFVGSLIPIKALEILISATREARANGTDIRLDVYGPGDTKNYKFETGIIEYKGIIPFGRTQLKLVDYDLLVLPSNYDGWGVVINEAILSRVPVFCSDRVGARTLIEKFDVGEVFPVNDYKYLSSLFVKYASDHSSFEKMKEACFKATKIIQPESAAMFIFDTINTQLNEKHKPSSPWY
tara:strand:- start:15561 stop:16703 length:1143 start_codon:yes stop_codon:yes gene_type:complete